MAEHDKILHSIEEKKAVNKLGNHKAVVINELLVN